MKICKFILILCFGLFSQFAFSQNFVTTEKALELIETKQAEVSKELQEGSIDNLKSDIYNYFFEVSVIYLKDGSDLPEIMVIAFDKCLKRFEDNQEDVVIVRDEIANLLTIQ